MAATTVPGFSVQERGFRFANSFGSVPVTTLTIPWIGQISIGNAANGLCGGMVFAVADYFHLDLTVPSDREPPDAKTALFNYIARRLIDSFDLPWGPARYFEWMTLPDQDQPPVLGIASRTRQEWPKIRSELDARKVIPLGLIRAHSSEVGDLGKNHQVLAYGYDLDETTSVVTLKLYDPNHPLQEVQLRCSLDPAAPLNLQYWTGEPTRGFFASPYVAVDPRPAASPDSPWKRFLGWLRGRRA